MGKGNRPAMDEDDDWNQRKVDIGWRTWALLALCMASMALPPRKIVDLTIQLLSCPHDPAVGTASYGKDLHNSAMLQDKHALVVGGTRGVGRGIALTLSKSGAHVVAVGRNTTSIVSELLAVRRTPKSRMDKLGQMDALSVDLSTVDGALYLCELLKHRGVKFDFVFFTVGRWPDYSAPLSSDGIDKVVALDLLAHHAVLKGLYQHGLLANNARVMNTIASTQNFPFQSSAAVLARLEQPPGMLPFTLFPVAVAGDAWLQATSKRMPNLHLVGMFPGIVSTELPAAIFPLWLMPFVRAAMWPIARSEVQAGRAHVAVLISHNAAKKPVSYFNHLLEGRETHYLAYDEQLSEGVYKWLDRQLEVCQASIGSSNSHLVDESETPHAKEKIEL